eukprot:m.720162 g.720162  ORF g.720162 m.720162 type:complete len:439 (-) comp23003_c0_seq15:144-1460(-)
MVQAGGFVGASIVAFLAACHMAQKYLPPPKPKILGIDLGTTYSCVGVYQAGTGKVEILEDHSGRRTIPSVVAYVSSDVISAESNKFSPSVLVGVAAKTQASLNPTNTIYESKRFIGRPYNPKLLDDDVRFPFAIINGTDGKFMFEVSSNGERQIISPEDVGAAVIGELKRTAEMRLARSVHQAVMSVPAEFTAEQRNATVRAAKLAGLEVLRILSEPTAAAMAYGLHTKASVRYIIVFDWGGGTLDVCLLQVHGGMFITHAIAGNKHLGGEDLSHRLYEHVLAAYTTTFDVDAPSVSAETKQELRVQVDHAKIQLSTAKEVQISVEDFNLAVTRQEFEALNADLLAAVMEPLEQVVRDADISKDMVDEIVLVGGSTRIPKVREMLTEYLGKPPCASIDPDEAVAVGVAMQAGIIAGAWPLQVSALEIPFEHRTIKADL